MMLERSVSINGRELETMLSFTSPKQTEMTENELFGKSVSTKSIDNSSYDHLSRSYNNLSEKNFNSPLAEPRSQRDLAALRLQKVYKSFRTRRQLADCAVLAEQRWWKALDFAELKRSSISFFDLDKPESALSRWSRARKRAAKVFSKFRDEFDTLHKLGMNLIDIADLGDKFVGKGLSKDTKARKLALQHWLEAIDPRHRYGHNLQFYYIKWLRCDSNQPFFYWLDIGDGKEFSSERCPRLKLQQQCIKYLGPVERKVYEVAIKDGRLFYKENGNPVQTTGDTKWIFVLSTSKTLYVGQKNKGTFQHSSFLAGGATLSAGRLVVDDGVLKAVWPHSGHYLPTEENFQEFVSFLKLNKVDLTDVKKSPRGNGEEDIPKANDNLLVRDNPLEAKLPSLSDLRNEDPNAVSNSHQPLSRLSSVMGSKIARLEIPKRSNVLGTFVKLAHSSPTQFHSPYLIQESGYETAEESFIDEEDFMVSKSNLFVEDQLEEDEHPIPKEKILKRIDSHKGMKSYQLANHLSTKWTTGAGPRIGCMRDYPPELQSLILEQQNLSPRTRTAAPSPQVPPLSRFSPHVAFPIPLADTINLHKVVVSEPPNL